MPFVVCVYKGHVAKTVPRQASVPVLGPGARAAAPPVSFPWAVTFLLPSTWHRCLEALREDSEFRPMVWKCRLVSEVDSWVCTQRVLSVGAGLLGCQTLIGTSRTIPCETGSEVVKGMNFKSDRKDSLATWPPASFWTSLNEFVHIKDLVQGLAYLVLVIIIIKIIILDQVFSMF